MKVNSKKWTLSL